MLSDTYINNKIEDIIKDQHHWEYYSYIECAMYALKKFQRMCSRRLTYTINHNGIRFTITIRVAFENQKHYLKSEDWSTCSSKELPECICKSMIRLYDRHPDLFNLENIND